MSWARQAWITVAGVTLITLLAAQLRLAGLDARTVGHLEMYVPGIHTPHGISVPEERLTLAKVVTGTFSADTHPPGFYILMWCWTKRFGTSVLALRLPAALLGIACVPLLFWLATLIHRRTDGWIASILLAVTGHHIYWSQMSRMYIFSCFFGLVATILLVRIAQSDERIPFLEILYVFVILAGLTMHIFFWTLFATHMLWTLGNAWSKRLPLPGVAKSQILAFILGSPLLAFAGYQTGTPLAELSRNIPVFFREYFQFSFALVGFVTDNPYLLLAGWLLFFLAVVLFAFGAASVQQTSNHLLTGTRGPSTISWGIAAMVATCAILIFIHMAKAYAKPEPSPTLRITEKLIVLPALFFIVGVAIQRSWKWLVKYSPAFLHSRFLVGEQSVVLALAIVPFLLLSIVSIFKPILNERGLVLLDPYLTLVIAWGIGRVARYRVAAVALLLVLAAASYENVASYSRLISYRADYKKFAALFAPQIQSTDLVFVEKAWYATPIFYYLNTGWDRYAGKDFPSARERNPHARIWVLVFQGYENRVSQEMRGALAGYVLVRSVEAGNIRAELYSPEAGNFP
jgi:uncharacterized membrane protein